MTNAPMKAVRRSSNSPRTDNVRQLKLKPLPLTELGLAERLLRDHARDLRYCEGTDSWMCWDGKMWVQDTRVKLERIACQVIRGLGAEASAADHEQRREILKFAVSAERAKTVKATVALCRAANPSSITTLSQDELDPDPFLLNVKNGTLCLRTGKLGNFDRSHHITKMAPVEYSDTAECPQWLAFLDRVFQGDQELIRFVQKMVGYSLTGSTGEQVFFILHGKGANGKSTFLNVIQFVLGEYAATVSADLVLAGRTNKDAERATPAKARIQGRRLLVATESEPNRKLAEDVVKQVTGGDKITARLPYAKSEIQFTPVGKLLLATNHQPELASVDHGTKRRVKLVPFAVQIPPAEQDKQLEQKLRGEQSGILRWAVEGCLAWLAEGLGEPPAVREATALYLDDQDALAPFIETCCELDSTATVTHKELKAAYTRFCETEQIEAKSDKAFATLLKQRDGVKAWRTKAARGYQGLRLK
ncbi:MAG: phage/plasmid primase, P4 family [Planctomyces sp.]